MDATQFDTFAIVAALKRLEDLMRLSLKAALAQLELQNKALHGAQVPHNKVLVIGEIKQALGLPVEDDMPVMPVEKPVVLVYYADPNENAPLSLGIAFLNDYNMLRDAIIAPPGYEIVIRKVGREITVTRQPHR